MSKHPYLLIVLALLISSIAPVGIVYGQELDQTVTLQQGVSSYTGCTDTYLVSSGGTDYAKNFGTDNDPNDWTKYRDDKVRYSTTSYSQWVTLIRFDLSVLPTNCNITSASLSLYHYDDSLMGSGDWLSIGIYALQRPWTEGVGPHNGDDRTGASWYYQYASPDTTQWYNGGARGTNHDRDANYDANTTLYYNNYGWATWSGTEVTNTVREWYLGSRANNGWQMDSTGSNDVSNGVLFHNSEFSISSPDYAYRPKLTITYNIVPEPSSLLALVSGLGVLVGIGRRRK